ncbi:MAG: protein BatD [Gammaproteobacteria bacterium]|nr:protein BatD [Gammaproteobacteria bacterium]
MNSSLQWTAYRLFGLTVLVFLPLLPTTVHAAEITARLSRNPVTLGESFQLTFEAPQAPDGEPDLSPLEQDFEILSRSQSQRLQMVNGELTRAHSWNLALMAKRRGTLTIPPIPFGRDRSRELAIEVVQPAPAARVSDRDIIVQVETDHDKVYRGQQIILTVKLYRGVNTDNASLSDPQADDPDLIVVKLGEDEQYEKRLEGRYYTVVERRYALFPQRDGPLTLAPIVFQAETTPAGSGSNRFFGSPFGAFRQPGQIRRVQSESLGVEVSAPPAGAPVPWLPTKDLQLQDSWEGAVPELRVGEPVTRTLLMLADGLSANQLPEFTDTGQDGIKQYPDKPALEDKQERDGIVGIRQLKVAIVPGRPGRFTLPAIEIPWWNTVKNHIEVSRIPERTLQVQGTVAANPTDTRGEPLVSAEKAPSAAASPTHREDSPPLHSGDTPWLSMLLGIGWLATLGAWWWSKHRDARSPAVTRPVSATTLASRKIPRIQAACERNNAQATAQALLDWASSRWPDVPPRSLGALSGRLNDHGFTTEIAILEQFLYGDGAPDWRGSGLWQSFSQVIESGDRPKAGPTSPMAPLYPS